MRVHNVLLSIPSVFVNVDLGVHTVNVQVRGNSPRVNLNLSRIYLDEHVVKLLELLHSLVACLSSQLEVIDNLFSQLPVKLWLQGEADGSDGRRIFFGDSFDIHASLFGVDAAKSLVLAVVEESQVNLSIDVDSLVDKHGRHGEALSRRLVSDEVIANHALSLFSHDFCSVHNVHTSLHSASQVTFAAAACLNLCFDDEAM